MLETKKNGNPNLQTLNLEWKQDDTLSNKTLIYKHQMQPLNFETSHLKTLYTLEGKLKWHIDCWEQDMYENSNL
jgi:hypothetical protein